MSDVKDRQTAPKDRAVSKANRLTDARGSDKKGVEPGRTIKPKAQARVTLNLAAEFENPWTDPRQEIAAMQAKPRRWHPAIDSWEAAVGKRLPVVTNGLPQFLGFIQQQKKGSISRLNLFTHGSKGAIALSGKINATTGSVTLDKNHQIDGRLAETESTFSNKGSQENFSLGSAARALADRFAANACIVIYACNTATDLEVLQIIADTFVVRAGGFNSSVYMWNTFDETGQKPNIERGYMGIGSTEENARNVRKGYKHLEPDIVWRLPRT